MSNRESTFPIEIKPLNKELLISHLAADMDLANDIYGILARGVKYLAKISMKGSEKKQILLSALKEYYPEYIIDDCAKVIDYFVMFGKDKTSF